jgi:asparagine synthase (glutamine-hydrolysing)
MIAAMCGIAGRANVSTGRPVAPELIAAMTGLLSHRGPDGDGVVVRDAAGLGHRRLAVIDLSPSAAQPMASDDERCWITFNGEIYNYQELRAALERRGHRFRSQSDTEVILHLYQERGAALVEDLRGMFAFAIWDEARQELFAARDRIGKKPFYYWIDRDGLAFASEPKAFLADPSFEPRPNLQGIWDYLTYQYVPAPASGFEGVLKLPPGHTLTASRDGVRVARYWRLSYATKFRGSPGEAREALEAELETAARLRLIADVPLGAFLSGGVDSSLVVALMARAGARPIRTFSIGFDEAAYNELPFAREVAERFGTEHHEFVVRPDALAVLPALIWHYNEPYADSSAIPTYYLARETRRHVTVALNGDGGDESFGGYDRYQANRLARVFDAVPLGVRRALARAVARLPAGPVRSLRRRAIRLLEAAAQPRERRYARWITHFDPETKARLCTPDFARAGGRDSVDLLLEWYRASDAPDFVDATLDVDAHTYLPDDLLVKVDIASMAHGLEARSPLLDHRVMELAASLPSSFKLRGLEKKWILKRVARGLVPERVLTRPKMGFGVPIDVWLKRELREMVEDVLFSRAARSRGYFDAAVVRRLVDDHVGGRRDRHFQIWNLLMLELWHQTFIDRRPSAPAVETLAAVVSP